MTTTNTNTQLIEYPVTRETIAAAIEQAADLTIESINDKAGIAAVSTARKGFKKLRVQVNKHRLTINALEQEVSA